MAQIDRTQFARRTLANWRVRFAALTKLSAEQPGWIDAWRRQVEIRILRYLLGRYEHTIDDPRAWPTSLADSPPTFWSAAYGLGRPPRTREEIRGILTRIATANAIENCPTTLGC
jgi:hypothetical protein